MIGIYKITNNINEKIYIGCSIDIEQRWKDHKLRHLNENDKSFNTKFYRAMRKYGKDNFKFEIIETCTKDELYDKEIYYISKYNSTDDSIGYNISIGGDASGLNNEGQNHPNAKLTDDDIKEIRTLYSQCDKTIFEVYEQYKHLIGWSGFKKIWSGYTWTKISMDVYTDRNKLYHRKKGLSRQGEANRSSILSEEDVISIRKRKKNGESSIDVFKDYSHRMKRSSFLHVWNETNWKHIKI